MRDDRSPVTERHGERRREDRVAARVEVRFRDAGDAARAFRAYSMNLSVGGLCLRTDRTYQKGAELNLVIEVNGAQYEVRGVVAWTKPKAIGVRFVQLTKAEVDAFSQMVASLKK
jgi:uncharacterized protein (TIGR02266 family)